MATIAKIESLLQKHDDELPENYIAAATLVLNDASVPHAAILIRYRGEGYLFHYTGKEVKFQTIEDATRRGSVYYLKGVDFVEPILLPSFVNRCKKITANAKPEYGYFYDPGSHYDDNFEFHSPNGYPEFMTCVGFCINVFRYFIDTELFENSDWNIGTVTDEPTEYAKKFMDRAKEVIPSLEWNNFKKEIRRILPIEYLASAYSKKKPVKKSFTDKTSKKLNKIIEKKVVSSAAA